MAQPLTLGAREFYAVELEEILASAQAAAMNQYTALSQSSPTLARDWLRLATSLVELNTEVKAIVRREEKGQPKLWVPGSELHARADRLLSYLDTDFTGIASKIAQLPPHVPKPPGAPPRPVVASLGPFRWDWMTFAAGGLAAAWWLLKGKR